MKKLRDISSRFSAGILLVCLLLLWQLASSLELVPKFMLPSPVRVLAAFFSDFPALMRHTVTSLTEAFSGLLYGIAAAFLLASLMDASAAVNRTIYPLLLLTQTVPPIAVAPLLVLWMGYGMAPKIMLVFLVCFFPVTIALLGGFASADPDAVRLLKSMGAGRLQIFRHIKLPSALPEFFSGLRISVSYAVVGAVIAEWLGGDGGLGVYMTRVRKSYAFDKMFAVIIWISLLTLLLMKLVDILAKRSMPWQLESAHT